MLKLVGQVTFYSILMTVLAVILGAAAPRVKMIPRALFPLLFDGQHYWFITIYMLLYLVTPLFKPAVEKISRRRLLVIVIILFMLWSFLPYTLGHLLKMQDFGYSTFSWFILMYLSGALIRKYSDVLAEHRALILCLLIVGTVVHFGSCVIHFISPGSGLISGILIPALAERSMNGIMVTINAALYLMLFCNLNPKVPKWTYTVSAATFGVYLIHDHLLINDSLWHGLFRTTEMVDHPLFIPYSILCVLTVFVVCTAVEIVRKSFIEKPIFNTAILNNICSRTDQWLDADPK